MTGVFGSRGDEGALDAESAGAAAWDRVAHEGQRAPGGDWTTWLFLGGRGAGKTRAGAEWVWGEAARLARTVGAAGRIALVAPTLHDARAVMVEGPSGVLNLPFRSGARFEPSLRRVVFPGGVLGLIFSAREPERLRGPQFHAAWGDEFCAWAYGVETLAMLRLGLRLSAGDGERIPVGPRSQGSALSTRRGLAASPHAHGDEESGRAQAPSDRVARGSPPRLMLTSTPKPGRLLRGVLDEPGLVRTDAATATNAAHLAPGFLAAMLDLYGGTRRAAQELDGRVLEVEGALFTNADLVRARILGGGYRPSGYLSPAIEAVLADPVVPPFDQVVVAVDPPAGPLSGRARDACGIVVAGRAGDRVLVLADRTVRGLSPEGWAGRVRAAVEAFGAHRVVVETNQGGAMAGAVLRAAGLTVPIRRVHAVLGKAARAEPVAALYEQGRVAHAAGLEPLEEELCGLGGEGGGRASPDRADALVWAVTDLLLQRRDGPWVRAL
ncbi:MAG: phage terminase large subunit-like protein [Brevundimonas sp.]|jgi:phage terminase large subunit-like protein|uniref:phage terminase large subunit family protein n=1 Tax=Brevundimonas sp. TaxID=1871086 RepID=UPI0039E5A137